MFQTVAEMEAAVLEGKILRAANEQIRAENKRLSGKVAGLLGKVKRLQNEVEALRATYELPTKDEDLLILRRLFPRLPFIHAKQREVFLLLWRHRKGLLAGEDLPPFLSKPWLHLQLYSHLKFPPTQGVISVYIFYLRKELLATRFTIVGRTSQGWRLVLLEQSAIQPEDVKNKS